jgi:hypothetical protein
MCKEGIKIAERCGLVLVSIKEGKNHRIHYFQNAEGKKMAHPFPSHNKISSFWDTRNFEAQCKRFARGQTHGLKIV